MISIALLSALLLGLTSAAVVPTAPGPGQVFREGDQCTLSWSLDTTGKWTSFNVDLMSGSNFAMQPVTNVFKGRDGTKGENTYSWKCPQVTPNSAIYFYQFTQDGADTTWTTRFTIASPTGQVTPPANSVQPGGAAIPWGIGQLAGAGASSAANNQTATPPPTGSNTTALTTPATNSSVSNATSSMAPNNSTTAGSGSTTSPAPSQSTSGTGSTGQNRSTSTGKNPSTSNTSPTTSDNSTASPTSGAPSLSMCKSSAVVLAFIAAFLV